MTFAVKSEDVPGEWLELLRDWEKRPDTGPEDTLAALYPLIAAHALDDATRQQWETSVAALTTEEIKAQTQPLRAGLRAEIMLEVTDTFEVWRDEFVDHGVPVGLSFLGFFQDLMRVVTKGEKPHGPRKGSQS
jgi:hypothetical protein